MGSGLDIRKDVDSLSCSAGLTEVGAGVVDQNIRFIVYDTEGSYMYFVGSTKIFRMNILTFVFEQVYSGGTDITGARILYHSAGTRYIYWADRANLHRKELPGLSDWTDADAGASWPQTTLENSVHIPHYMEVVAGSLLIGNGYKLAYVGRDQSFSTNVLEIPAFKTITTIYDRGGQAVLGTKLKNYTYGVNAIIGGEIPISQSGENGELFTSDMVNSVPLKIIPGGGTVASGAVALDTNGHDLYLWEEGAVVDPDINSWLAKHSMANLAYLGVSTNESGYGGLWTLGRLKNNTPFVLNLDYPVSGTPDIGAVFKGALGIFVSVDNDVFFVDAATRSNGIYTGLDLIVPNKLPNQITTWGVCEMLMKPLPAGCSVEYQYKRDKDGDYIAALTQDGQTQFDIVGATSAVFQIADEAKVFTPRVILNPSGSSTPEIFDIYQHFT